MHIWSSLLRLALHELISSHSQTLFLKLHFRYRPSAPWSCKWYLYLRFPIKIFYLFIYYNFFIISLSLPCMLHPLSERYATILSRYWLLYPVVVQIADTADQNEFPIYNCPVVSANKTTDSHPPISLLTIGANSVIVFDMSGSAVSRWILLVV
jgi:hypothetical protein